MSQHGGQASQSSVKPDTAEPQAAAAGGGTTDVTVTQAGASAPDKDARSSSKRAASPHKLCS